MEFDNLLTVFIVTTKMNTQNSDYSDGMESNLRSLLALLLNEYPLNVREQHFPSLTHYYICHICVYPLFHGRIG